MSEIRGITLDFYQTLVRHAGAGSRGASLTAYLASQGLESKAWEHQVLYDVFEFYGDAYREDFSAREERTFWEQFAERVFRRLEVAGPAEKHAEAIRACLGPSSLALYEDVAPLLERMRQRDAPTGIVSNWQRGLAHFCRELGILDYFDFVVVSAEVGFQKPDPRMFEIAAERMGMPAEHILHVGDNPVQDVDAARRVGFQTLHLVRQDSVEQPRPPVIGSLRELEGFELLA